MFKTGSSKVFLAAGMIFVFILASFPLSMAAGQTDPFSETRQKLDGISEKERETIEKLFVMSQDIRAMEQEEADLTRDIDKTSDGIKASEAAIAREEAAYEKKRDSLEQVLKSYQRMGPGSYLEIILASDDLPSLLMRINILRDITRNTGELMGQLEQSRDKLSAGKAKLSEELASLKDKQAKLTQALAGKKQLQEEQEKYLASLAEKKEFYQKYLADIQQIWESLGPYFSAAVKEFSGIIQGNDLPADAVRVSYNFLSIKGYLEAKALNDIVKAHPQLPDMTFSFYPDKVELQLPEKNLVLSGTFVMQQGNALEFEVKEGSFCGLPLETGSLEELFKDGDLVLDLKPLLGGYNLGDLEVKDGYLEFSVLP